jgi:type IV secretion system protein VirB9
MNLKKFAIIGAAFLLATTVSAAAEKIPVSGVTDARIKHVVYHENDVVQLKMHYGFITAVQFSDQERIETITIGDSSSWKVDTPKRPNIMFIKPVEQNVQTNLMVLTNRRTYTFQLSVGKADEKAPDDMTYRLVFNYPDNDGGGLVNFDNAPEVSENKTASAEASIKDMNFNYSFSGAKSLQPDRVFDDGKFTYFQFSKLEATPAIFSVDEKGNESIVNFTSEGDDMLVVHKVSRQFTLRNGDTTTCIFNDSYKRPSGKQAAIAPLGKIKPKKTASLKKQKTNVPEPLPLAFFANIHPDNTATYNH